MANRIKGTKMLEDWFINLAWHPYKAYSEQLQSIIWKNEIIHNLKVEKRSIASWIPSTQSF